MNNIIVYIIIYLIGIGIKFVALPFIPANIAKNKGYSFAGFFVLGIFFFIIGLIIALCLDDRNSEDYRRRHGYYQDEQNEQFNARNYCSNCGCQLEYGQRFCPNCGSKL